MWGYGSGGGDVGVVGWFGLKRWLMGVGGGREGKGYGGLEMGVGDGRGRGGVVG